MRELAAAATAMSAAAFSQGCGPSKAWGQSAEKQCLTFEG